MNTHFFHNTGNPRAPPEMRIILLLTTVVTNLHVFTKLAPEPLAPEPADAVDAPPEATGAIETLVSLP